MIVLDEHTEHVRFVSEACTASLRYRRRSGHLVLLDTFVPTELHGQRIGGRLVAAAVEHAVSEGLTIVPICPFARQWLRANPNIASQSGHYRSATNG